MKLARKILLATTLISVFGAVGLLISAIFGINVFKGTLFNVLLSFATLAVAGAFSLNALNFMKKNRVIAFITFALLGTLTVIAFIIFWGNIELTGAFAKVVGILAMTTIFFNIIVSNYLKLGRNNFVIQVITYVLIGAIDIILTLEILEVNVLLYIPRLFVVACLVCFALLVTLSILGKKVPEEARVESKPEAKEDGNIVKLKKEEYEAMLKKIGALEAEIERLKVEKNSVDK